MSLVAHGTWHMGDADAKSVKSLKKKSATCFRRQEPTLVRTLRQ